MASHSVSARQYNYTLDWGKPSEHTYYIELTTENQTAEYTDFRTNAWRPGRYIMQNYAAAVSHFDAIDAQNNKKLKWRKIDKDIWRVFHSPETKQIKIAYRFYANVYDAGASFVDEEIAYFNPVGLFMNVNKEYDAPCQLTVKNLPSKWKIATPLRKTKDREVFTANTYHEFVDSPTIFAEKIKQFDFKVDNLKVYVHFAGNYKAPDGAEQTYINDVSKIIKEQIAVFGEIPTDEYHFIYGLVSFQMRHAVEHLRSAMFVLPESVAESEKSFAGLYSITSHEFFHVWNIKTLRPAALYPYDYSREFATGLHWFTEGITDYYADLVMARSGVYTQESFLKDITSTIQSLENSYAARVVSPEVSSWESWLATSEFNNPFHRTSYYPLGTRIGLLMDFELMRRTKGLHRFDDVFKKLYKECYKNNKGVEEDGVQKALEDLTKDSWQDFFDVFVRGTSQFNYKPYFDVVGLEVKIYSDPEPNNPAARLGLSRLSSPQTESGLLIQLVRPDGQAADAGLQDGDIITELDGKKVNDLKPFSNIKAGETYKLKVKRNGEEKTFKIKASEADFPVKVEITRNPKATTVEQLYLEKWMLSAQQRQ